MNTNPKESFRSQFRLLDATSFSWLSISIPPPTSSLQPSASVCHCVKHEDCKGPILSESCCWLWDCCCCSGESCIYCLRAMVVVFATVFLSCIRSYSVASDRVASRVSRHMYAGREFYVKRDDENSLSGPALSSVSGNKSRKLLHLSKMKPFPDILASYGGSQSNSMLAIAKVAASSSAGSTFIYFMKPLPKFLKSCPTGNLKAALDLGMLVSHI